MTKALSTWLLCASTAFSQSMMELTVDDAIKTGMAHSKKLQAAMRRSEGASARAEEMRSVLLPSVKLSASYQRLSDVDPFRVVVPFSPEPITISPIVLNNYNLRVSVQQPLFTGFRLRNTARSAEFLAGAANHEYETGKADIILSIKNAYWILYQTIELKKVVDENVRRFERHVSDTELLVQSGLATTNDLLKIQVQLSNAKLSQIDAVHDVQVATMNLNNAIGQPLDSEVRLLSKPEEENGTDVPLFGRELELHALLRQALVERPELLSLEMQVKAGDAHLSAMRGNLWPQIYLSGNYYNGRPNPRYLPSRDEFKDSWDIGVSVQLDVWNWGATGHQIEQAEAQFRQAEIVHEQKKDDIVVEVTRAYQRVTRTVEKIRIARLAVEQATENARVTEEKHKNGLATSSDVIDAEVALLQAQTNHTTALVEHELSRAALVRAVGVDEEGKH